MKYWTLYTGILYIVGFIILSTRLAFLNIFIKDFFTLDYFKAGLLFLFVNLPIYFIANEALTNDENSKRRHVLFQALSFLVCGIWMILLSGILFKFQKNEPLSLYLSLYIFYPLIIYFFSKSVRKIKFKSLKKDGLEFGFKFIFFLIAMTAFANIVYPKIQFRFGGGAPYNKVLHVKNNIGSIQKIDAQIFYENDNWIHFKDKNGVITSFPKTAIIKMESYMENDLLKKWNERIRN